MRKLITNSAVIFVILMGAQVSVAKTMLFGGVGHKQYLGCVDCNEMGSDSICNGFGEFGNEFSSSGVFNEFSEFGNEFSSQSPWNEFSTSEEVPVLVDDAGKFYGYFTINEMRGDAVKFAPALYNLFKAKAGNLERIRVEICRSMGKGS